MNKGLKIFTKIIYYVFTFFIGLIVAIMLPLELTVTYIPQQINNSINSADYSSAIGLVSGGGYYNSDKIYQEDKDNCGFVIFESVTLNYEDGENADGSILNSSYSGFLYKASDYNVSSTVDNKTKLEIVKDDNTTYNYTLLDYDSNNDDVYDNISYHQGFQFVYFCIEEVKCSSIKEIRFLDKDGQVYYQHTFDQSLTYTSSFYNDTDSFVQEFNSNNTSSNLSSLDEQLRSNPNYKMFSYGSAEKLAQKKAIPVVVIYFLVVYLIADLLLGNRYIIKFFSWLLYKVFKIKRKEKEVKEEDVIGTDYLSTVTFTLDKGSNDEFDTAVTITYSGKEEINITLYSDDNYTTIKKIKAGTYLNPFININDDYEIINLPAPLEIKGYKMQINLKLKKVERK